MINRNFACLSLFSLMFSAALACDFPGGGAGESGDSDSSDSTDEGSKSPDKDSDKDPGKDPEAPEGAALGLSCERAQDCASGVCREIKGLGPDAGTVKTCSMCSEDDQCQELGLGLGCLPTLDFVDGKPAPHFACSSGELGAECDKDKHCQDDLQCVSLGNGGPGSGMKTCSACAKDSDCSDDAPMCLRNMAGYMECKPENSLPNGYPCEMGERGDRACEQFCGPLDLGGEGSEPSRFGICGECRTDADCAEDQRCKPAKFEGKMNPAACVAKDSGE